MLRTTRFRPYIGRRPKHLAYFTQPDGLDEWLTRFTRGPLAVDTETTGLTWWRDRVGGICLAAGDSAMFAWGNALRPVARWLGDQVKRDRELVFHHAKFDLHMLRESFGLHVPYPVHDTKLQSFLLDNRGTVAYVRQGRLERNHHLKDLAQVFVDPNAKDAEKELLAAIKANGGQHKGDWLCAPVKKFALYSALDPWYTLQLHHQFIERINSWVQPASDEPVDSLATLYETERWLLLALRDMEERGITVRREFLEAWRTELAAKLKQHRRLLWKLAGKREINWNSTPQLQALLFNRRTDGGLGCEVQRVGKSGPSTDKAVLTKLNHPIGAALLQYRADLKQHTSYAVGLLDAIREHADGTCTIHTWFNQDGAGTGRMSAQEPNLQQQTRTSGVRKAYVPRKGLRLGFADYNQVEMRFAAHLANEPTFVRGFNTDRKFDTHTATARQMYGLTKREPTKFQRGNGKTVNFLKLFGGGEDKLTETLVKTVEYHDAVSGCMDFGYKPSRAESPHRVLAQFIIKRFNAGLPALRKAISVSSARAKHNGCVLNLFGRHRYLDEGREYAAFNTEVQGSAGDQAKRGLVRVYRELQLGTGELALLLQIHDENVYESEGNKRTHRRVVECMQELKRFRVPIIADVSESSTNWQEKQEVAL